MAPTDVRWDEFGPEGQTEGRRLGTDMSCPTCDVQWHSTEGWTCWACGQPGKGLRNTHWVACGMDVRFVENNPGPIDVG